MPFREPIPIEVLRYLGRSQRQDEDVQALLWEIKRLQSKVLIQHQLSKSTQPWGGVMGVIWKELQEDLEKEPCVVAMKTLNHRLSNP